MLPLHFALQNSSIFGDDVVHMLLRINPQAAFRENMNGVLPLMLAVRSCAPLPTIQALLTLNPAAACCSTRAGFNPLHYVSNGLDEDPTDQGAGNGEFRTGSLRNIALTFPYMHDGRFGTLSEVLDHDSTGIQPHRGLGGQLRDVNRDPAGFPRGRRGTGRHVCMHDARVTNLLSSKRPRTFS